MSTYETIKNLCKQHSIAVTALEKELGFGRGSIGKLRNGQTSAERLQKIADYFNVSVNSLIDSEEKRINSVDRVKKICKERKIPISKLEQDLGFSNGYISQLRKGVFPADRLVLIADYLQVSADFLMTGVDSDGLTEKDNRDIARDMENIRSKLLSGSDGPLSYDGEPIPEEDAELLLGQIELMMRRLKPINKEKYNPNKNKK